jgi:hypothetical protein
MEIAARVCGVAVFAALLASQLAPAPAAAQGPDVACFFEDVNFLGRRLCLATGQRAASVGALNDTFSSAIVPPGVRVAMCEHHKFEGRCIHLDRSVSNFQVLGDWNDKVSSVAVQSLRAPAQRGGVRLGQGAVGDQVCFYEHANFRGRIHCARVGAAVPVLGSLNDRLSSVHAPPGVVVTACEHSNFRGRCVQYRGSVPSIVDMNDRISSFRSASE